MALTYTPKPAEAGTLNSVKSIVINDLATNGKLVFKQNDLGVLNDYLGSVETLAALGSRINIEPLDSNSVRVSVNAYAGEYQEVTDVGVGTLTEPTVNSNIFSYNTPKYKSEKYINGDSEELDANGRSAAIEWLGDRLTYNLTQARIDARTQVLKVISDLAGRHVAVTDAISKQELYDLVQAELLRYLSANDKTQGIQIGGITYSNLTILARPEWFARLVGILGTGDSVKQYFDLGVLATAQVAGVQVILEPTLPGNTPFLICTDSTAFYNFKIVKAGVIDYEDTGDLIGFSRIKDILGKAYNHYEDPTARVGALTSGVSAPTTRKPTYLATAIRITTPLPSTPPEQASA